VRTAALLAVACVSPFYLSAQSSPEATEAPATTNASDTEDENIVTLPVVMVTADKISRPLQEVPMAVVAVDAKTVENFNLLDVSDIEVVSPGLDMKPDPRSPVPSLRGIAFNPDSGTTASVDMYWNEVPVSANTAFRSMYDVGQIEVLRGPQGTLRGRSSPGGAITYAARRPDLEKFGFNIEQSLSDIDLVNTQAAINIPIVSGKLAVRLAGVYDANAAGDIHNIYLDEDTRSHTRSYRGTIGWKPTDDIEVNLTHQWLEQELVRTNSVEGDATYGAPLPSGVRPSDRLAVAPGMDTYEDNPILTSLTADWRLPKDHRLSLIAGRHATSNDISGEFYNQMNLIYGYSSPQLLYIESETYSYELRFSSVEHEKWDYVFGLYYEDSETSGSVQQVAARLWFDGPNPFVSSSPVPRAPDMEIPLNLTMDGSGSYKGVFTTQTFKFDDAWRLELGARYQKIESSLAQSDPALGIDSQATLDGDPFTGSASLSYKLRPGVNTYLTYGRSYRPGGTGFRTSAQLDEKYLHFSEETSNGLELGVKGAVNDNRLQFNAALFIQKFDGYISHSGFIPVDYQADGFQDDVVGITFNGDAESKGIELGATASLPGRVVLGVNTAYAKATWADGTMAPSGVYDANGNPVFNTPGEQVSYTDIGGDTLGDAPKFTFSSTIEWTRPMRSMEWFTRGLFYYKGEREIRGVPDPELPGYATIDLFVGLRSSDRRWEVTLWAKNALDEQVETNRGSSNVIGTWVSGYRMVTLNPPRELGVTAKFSF